VKHLNEVHREWPVAEGNPESTGRIDLLIRFKHALFGVEVKTEDNQYDKQKGYKESLDKLGTICAQTVKCVLIAKDEVSDDQRFDFRLRTWQDVSVDLRCVIAEFMKTQTSSIVAAMMTAFVAAIEQNLLGFGTAPLKRAQRGLPTLLPRKLVKYLERIESANGTKNTSSMRLNGEGL